MSNSMNADFTAEDILRAEQFITESVLVEHLNIGPLLSPSIVHITSIMSLFNFTALTAVQHKRRTILFTRNINFGSKLGTPISFTPAQTQFLSSGGVFTMTSVVFCIYC